MDKFVKSEPVDCVFRITTGSNDPLRDYASLFKDLECLLVKEDEAGDNQHYHCYVKGSRKYKLDTRLKKYFKGNQQYSCKIVKDKEMQCRYLCKGTESEKPIVIMNNIGVDVNEEYRKYWYDRVEYKERMKVQKKNKKAMIERVEEMIKVQDQRDSRLYSIGNIFNVIMEVCKRDGDLVPDDFLCIKYIETVRLRGGSDMSNKYDRIVDRMSKYAYRNM